MESTIIGLYRVKNVGSSSCRGFRKEVPKQGSSGPYLLEA